MKKTHYLFFGVAIFIFDKLIKLVVIEQTNLAQVNRNMSLGMELWSPLYFITVVVLLFVISRYWEKHKFAVTLILTGSLANITDRLIWGGVLDYLVILNNFIINFSDVLIVVGLSIFLIKFIQIQYNGRIF